MEKITGNEPIASCFLRKLGEGQDDTRIATPADLENKHFSHYIFGNKGLTIRQEFAARAMQAILSNPKVMSDGDWEFDIEAVCSNALSVADALINELNK